MNTYSALHAPVFENSGAWPVDTAKVLYAEDDPAIRRLSALALGRSGYAVTTVGDGQQAWEALHVEQFDLLVTDNDMPRLTGLELITKARLDGIELPIIVACGSADSFAGGEWEWLRLAATLQKPFSPDDLLNSVKQVLRAAASLDQDRDGLIPAFTEAAMSVEPVQHWGINE